MSPGPMPRPMPCHAALKGRGSLLAHALYLCSLSPSPVKLDLHCTPKRKMAKVRPSLASNPALRGASEVLDDLDMFLSDVGADEVFEGEAISQPYLDCGPLEFGSACAECCTGTSPLIVAASNGHIMCLKEMLKHSLDLDLTAVVSENGATLAHIAARNGDTEALKAVITAERSLCEVGDIRGATPLHVCAYHGHLDCLSCLLDSGANASRSDFDGATPAHFASASGHLECLKKLIDVGRGDPNAQTGSGETPGMIDYSRLYSTIDIIDYVNVYVVYNIYDSTYLAQVVANLRLYSLKGVGLVLEHTFCCL